MLHIAPLVSRNLSVLLEVPIYLAVCISLHSLGSVIHIHSVDACYVSWKLVVATLIIIQCTNSALNIVVTELSLHFSAAWFFICS